MTSKIFKLISIQILMLKIIATNASIKQYVLSGPSHPNLNTILVPSQQIPPTNYISTADIPSFSALSLAAPTSLPSTLSKAFSNFPIPSGTKIPVPTGTKTSAPIIPKGSSNPLSSFYNNPSNSGGLDSTVLNNLAIALQLLIVSNLLNLPPPEAENNAPCPENKESVIFDFEPSVYTNNDHVLYYEKKKTNIEPYGSIESFGMPNANFIGSSGFVEPNIFRQLPNGAPKLNPRSNMALMSPYEALASNSPFSDPILSSPYGSFGVKKELKSPYSAMLADNDVFSMGEFM